MAETGTPMARATAFWGETPQMALIDQVRAGLRDPFAATVEVGFATLTRAEARAVERALTTKAAERRLRLPRIRIIWRGVGK